MKTKTYKGNEKKLDKIEEYHKHFGWTIVERTDDKLVMTFDSSIPYGRALRKLEKQANIIRCAFPKKMIIWLVLCAIFLIPYFFLVDGVLFGSIDLNSIFSGFLDAWIVSIIVNALPILLISVGCLNAFFAIYQFIVFWAVKLTKHTTLEEIYRIADAYSGNVIDAPFPTNIEQSGPYTGEIEKMIDKIGDRG